MRAQWPPLGFRDAGVMYHSVGVPRAVNVGADPATGPGPLAPEPGVDGFFRESMEYQIAEWDVGGYASLGRIEVERVDGLPHLERPLGAWNVVDLLVVGDASAHLLNGHLVTRVADARYHVGVMATRLDEGHLQLQSEGAEIFFRRVRIRPIDDLDRELEQLRRALERPPRTPPAEIPERGLSLFNGIDLTGWRVHLAPSPHDPEQAAAQPVFRVVEEDGAPAIRIGGWPWGALSTEQAYENYHLTLDFKWGDDVRPGQERDSGVLYHGFGAPGLVTLPTDRGTGPGPLRWQTGWGGAFMQSLECELAPARAGLHRSLGQVAVEYASRQRSTPELEVGVWNRLEIVCRGNRSEFLLNDRHLGRVEGAKRVHGAEEIELTSGHIQLQSKGAEIFFRNLVLRRLSADSGRD